MSWAALFPRDRSHHDDDALDFGPWEQIFAVRSRSVRQARTRQDYAASEAIDAERRRAYSGTTIDDQGILRTASTVSSIST
jgi:hypothetical protein